MVLNNFQVIENQIFKVKSTAKIQIPADAGGLWHNIRKAELFLSR